MLHELVAYKLAGREKKIHALAIGAEPAVNVGLGCESHPGTYSGIAFRGDHMPKSAALARFARLPLRNQVVAGTQQLEIIQVVEHRNILRFQFPKN